MLHVVGGGPAPASLPGHRSDAAVMSLAVHAAAIALLVLAATRLGGRVLPKFESPSIALLAPTNVVDAVVFQPRPSNISSSGGGGGGNRQQGPIRRAAGIGRDAATLRIAKPRSTAGTSDEPPPVLPGLVLDAKPLASGMSEQMGLPSGGVSYGTSLGPGSGGGVGTGTGTGIGPGSGPGIGPGSGGGIGGGVFRAGGGVTAPEVIRQVKPSYTPQALLDRVQGSVWLELIVRDDGTPSEIRIVRSLDPGLNEQAILATAQWRFKPGCLSGKPVNVLVTVVIDFLIR